MKHNRLWLGVLTLLLLVPQMGRAQALRGYEKSAGYHYVHFGRYAQGAQGEVEPILWRVLEVKGNSAYLYSEYVLTNNRVHPDDNEYIAFGAAWNKTELHRLLNGPYDAQIYVQSDILEPGEATWTVPFVDAAFSEEEQAHLMENEELGRVFLASAEDLNNKEYGLGTQKSRPAYGTPYALENGLFKYQNGTSPYWTRSQSKSFDYGVRCTKVDGKIGYIRCVVMNEGVRPGIYLNIEGVTIESGDGSKEAPFVLAW